LTFAKESRDLLIDCCVEFIHLVSSEANEICEKETKKTISADHVVKALVELGFEDYVQEIQEIAVEHKEQQKVPFPRPPSLLRLCGRTAANGRCEKRNRTSCISQGCHRRNCYGCKRNFSVNQERNSSKRSIVRKVKYEGVSRDFVLLLAGEVLASLFENAHMP
jgi:hypothetical protein